MIYRIYTFNFISYIELRNQKICNDSFYCEVLELNLNSRIMILENLLNPMLMQLVISDTQLFDLSKIVFM